MSDVLVEPEEFERALAQEKEKSLSAQARESRSKKVAATFLVSVEVRDRIKGWAAKLDLTQGEYLAMVQQLFEDLYQAELVQLEFRNRTTPRWEAKAKLRKEALGGD